MIAKGIERQGKRRRLYEGQAEAARILSKAGDVSRVSKCMRHLIYGANGVEIWRRTVDGEKARARFGALMQCGSVWSCPLCSERISRERGVELNALLHYVRGLPVNSHGEECFIFMVTLTARHKRRKKLKPFLTDMKSAYSSLTRTKSYERLKADLLGFVSALEVVWTPANGWHPHRHILFMVWAKDEAEAQVKLETMRRPWLAALRKHGQTGNLDKAYHISPASDAGQYVSKFGAGAEVAFGNRKGQSQWSTAREMTLNGKTGHKGALTPWELLSESAAGNKLATALFIDFSQAFFRSQQLQWSRGLKSLIGLKEILDEDLLNKPEDDISEHPFAKISLDNWRSLLANGFTHIKILEVAEEEQAEDFWQELAEWIDGGVADRTLDKVFVEHGSSSVIPGGDCY